MTQIEINDLKYGDKTKLEAVISDFQEASILNRNMLTFQATSLIQVLQTQTGVKKAKIRKVYPNNIAIEIEERTPALVWQVVDKKYLVDESGVIWADYEDKFAEIPVIIDLKNLPVEKGKRVVSTDFTLFIRGLTKDFTSYTEVKMVKLEVVDTTEDLKVTSDSSWYAFFNTTRTAKNQLINLSRILNEAKMKKQKLEYIDLRIDNRIFYK